MPVRATADLAELQQLILARTIHKTGTIIGIDGMDGSGKTSLACQLTSLFCAIHIELDDLVNEKQDGYINHIRYDDLRNVIRQATAGGPVIIEGCCLRTVLDRLSLKVELHVYVKKVEYGYWQSGNFLEACCAVAAIAKEEEILRGLDDLSDASFKLSGLKRELIIYHFQYHPHDHADFIYERSEHPGRPELFG